MSTTAQHFPVLDEKPLRLIAQLYEHNKDFFDSPDCPYSEFVKELFQGELKANDFESHAVEMSDDDLTKNINDLHKRLEDYWHDVKDSDKSADKNTFFRLSVTLQEKLVTLKERMQAMRSVSEFMSVTIGILDEVLNADQRTEVMTRLEKFQKPDGSVSHG